MLHLWINKLITSIARKTKRTCEHCIFWNIHKQKCKLLNNVIFKSDDFCSKWCMRK